MTDGHPLIVPVNGLSTHAWVRGRGKPVVIVPGLGCASWMYARLARELARERQVFVYDPPGHGYSEGRAGYPVCISHLTDHLAAWMTRVNLRGAPLLGHSLGGEVIIDLAARYPHLSGPLIACAPTGIPENPSVRMQLLRLLRDLPRERPGLLLPGLKAYAHCGARRMILLARDQEDHMTGPLLGQVRVPTLLLDGLSDPVIRSWTVRRIQADIPGAVIRQIPGAPHGLTDTHPRAVAAFALEFLRELSL
ncbi:alpha/beta fold hydrolase [Deinococcus knuensis]|uniref:Alpha/beta hydrolase n=1 Tax=Deinococcus knuensis TaxID=1837380 RepID=A0ABQ2SE94_9DEIO|nr:alpha/beta hydrolase [Deinococcus knuensis]GGS24864.1 alpha/beta hydrolase [Deinococcus knuensis]